MNFTEKMLKCQEYIEGLEEERRKILVFQRELPLCLELVNHAIDACKKQLSVTTTTTEYFNGQSECTEQTSSESPVFEEFIPIKRASSCNDEDDEEQSHKSKSNGDTDKNSEKLGKKSDWLRSVQLWNQTSDQPIKEDLPKNTLDVKKHGGAFHPFQREKGVASAPPSATKAPTSAPTTTSSSTAESGGGGGSGNKKEEKESQSQRKARRCWSPDLHRRFLHALQQLGGCQVATPKQIRELMKVDGLTNDEVKSHLQKYRLHTRGRSSSTIQNNSNPQAPQFVVVGGIWVPVTTPEYAAAAAAANTAVEAAAATTTTANEIYAPVAGPPPTLNPKDLTTKKQQKAESKRSNSEEVGSHSEGGNHSSSSATSSSTHTTTAIAAF